jgi:hypothetical protein
MRPNNKNAAIPGGCVIRNLVSLGDDDSGAAARKQSITQR